MNCTMRTFLLLCAAILLLISQLSRAGECPMNVQKIKAGTNSPCDAWIVSEPTMQKIMQTDEQLELQKKLQLQMEHLRTLDQKEIEYYKVQSQSVQAKLEKEDGRRFWSNLGYFTLGVVLTGVAAKAAIESTR